MRKAAVSILTMVLGAGMAHGAVSFSGSPYTQDFNTLSSVAYATPTWSDDTTIPGWYASHGGGGGYSPFATYLVDDGTQVTHTLQSQGTFGNSDRALGCMSYNDNTLWGLRLTNNSGQTIDEVTVSYTGEQWRDQTSQTVFFGYKVGALTLSESGYTGVSALNFVPPHNSPPPYELDGNLPANRVALSQTFTLGSSWAPGSDLWLRWSTGPSQGSGVSIDDLTFSATIVPEPTVVLLLVVGAGLLGLRRRRH